MFDLTGKVALVTGASGGIGGAVARALHAQGAIVVLSGTRTEALESLKNELGSRAFTAVCNLADPVSVEALPKAADGFGFAGFGGQDVGDNRNGRRTNCHRGERLGHLVGGGLHHRAMKGGTDGERQHALDAFGLGQFRGAFDGEFQA